MVNLIHPILLLLFHNSITFYFNKIMKLVGKTDMEWLVTCHFILMHWISEKTIEKWNEFQFRVVDVIFKKLECMGCEIKWLQWNNYEISTTTIFDNHTAKLQQFLQIKVWRCYSIIHTRYIYFDLYFFSCFT